MRGVTDGPLLVFGPRSTTYDFGPRHPLTPRRFGPGIDLLRTVGAVPGLAPEPADDPELLEIHAAALHRGGARLSADPELARPEAGIAAYGDDPPFEGMHEASAAVAGGSIARHGGDPARARSSTPSTPEAACTTRCADRASGFCIYNDVALAMAAAREPASGSCTSTSTSTTATASRRSTTTTRACSRSRSTRAAGRCSRAPASPTSWARARPPGPSVNLPLEAETGERAGWRRRSSSPALAAAFGADLPRQPARLRQPRLGSARPPARDDDGDGRGGRGCSTRSRIAMPAAAGSRPAAVATTSTASCPGPGRWSGSRAPIGRSPAKRPAWRERWAADAARYDQAPPPEHFRRRAERRPARLGLPAAGRNRARSKTLAEVRATVLPRLLIVAEERRLVGSDGARPVRPAPGAPSRAWAPRRRSSRGWTQRNWSGSLLRRGRSRRPTRGPRASSCSRPSVTEPGSLER